MYIVDGRRGKALEDLMKSNISAQHISCGFLTEQNFSLGAGS